MSNADLNESLRAAATATIGFRAVEATVRRTPAGSGESVTVSIAPKSRQPHTPGLHPMARNAPNRTNAGRQQWIVTAMKPAAGDTIEEGALVSSPAEGDPHGGLVSPEQGDLFRVAGDDVGEPSEDIVDLRVVDIDESTTQYHLTVDLLAGGIGGGA